MIREKLSKIKMKVIFTLNISVFIITEVSYHYSRK